MYFRNQTLFLDVFFLFLVFVKILKRKIENILEILTLTLTIIWVIYSFHAFWCFFLDLGNFKFELGFILEFSKARFLLFLDDLFEFLFFHFLNYFFVIRNTFLNGHLLDFFLYSASNHSIDSFLFINSKSRR